MIPLFHNLYIKFSPVVTRLRLDLIILSVSIKVFTFGTTNKLNSVLMRSSMFLKAPTCLPLSAPPCFNEMKFLWTLLCYQGKLQFMLFHINLLKQCSKTDNISNFDFKSRRKFHEEGETLSWIAFLKSTFATK